MKLSLVKVTLLISQTYVTNVTFYLNAIYLNTPAIGNSAEWAGQLLMYLYLWTLNERCRRNKAAEWKCCFICLSMCVSFHTMTQHSPSLTIKLSIRKQDKNHLKKRCERQSYTPDVKGKPHTVIWNQPLTSAFLWCVQKCVNRSLQVPGTGVFRTCYE